MNSSTASPLIPSNVTTHLALSGLQLRVHTNLASLQTAWTSLLLRSDCYVFQTWEWNMLWQKHIGEAEGVQPHIIEVLNTQGVTVGIWPLGIYRQHGLRILAFLGETVSDYRAPLIATDWLEAINADTFSVLWNACLDAMSGYDLVRLTRMPERFEHTHNPMTALPQAERYENAYAARLPNELPDFMEERPKQLLANIRRSVRRMKEMGEYCYTASHAPEEQTSIFQALAKQKSRRWQETKSRDLFAEPAYLDFYTSIANDNAAQAWVSLCSLKVGETVVAAQWGLQFRNRYYWILPTYEAGTWLKYSCGSVLQLSTMEWAIEQGFSTFDLTVGDEPYKRQWTNEHLPLYRLQRAQTLKGLLYLTGTRLKEKAHASPKLRQFVRDLKRLSGRL